MISGSPKRLALEINIDHLVEAYKLSVTLRNLATEISIVLIREIDFYITIL